MMHQLFIITIDNLLFDEVKMFQNSIQKNEQSIQLRSKMAPFLKALIILASKQYFLDQGVIHQILQVLNEFRNAYQK
ncbi:unnamed protein product [Paramecium sonneborni]|uniref:Uncharacterized protein n=1 Tax=Paramecium sonneborni TaxID=65129 RepID=A0A8S1RIN2_9CILI|nr:unnamed protein product [Paramecium sonneborni]